jgi:hypothetical protein
VKFQGDTLLARKSSLRPPAKLGCFEAVGAMEECWRRRERVVLRREEENMRM